MDAWNRLALTRRHFFGRAALGLGGAALASLLPASRSAATSQLAGPNHAPRARRAVFLFMNGGPSQLDLWDHKPDLARWYDQDLPASVRGNQRLTNFTARQERLPVAPSRFRFDRHGRNGAWVSELLPWTAKVVDDLCIIRSMCTDEINHDPAMTFMCTGHALPGRPSLGAWLSYGLGSENANLPAFVVMTSVGSAGGNGVSSRLWAAGPLSSRHQGTQLRNQGDPILFLDNPPGVTANARRAMLDSLGRLNQRHYKQVADPEIEARIAQYEMAFRMQTSVPELADLSGERDGIGLYGPDALQPGSFAHCCLMARRLLEREVRFVQIFHCGWDHHQDVPVELPKRCRQVDQACYGLITDLHRRGLLDDTLVIWAGEFGRTTYSQGTLTAKSYGRDHHSRCFTAWLAGGGVRPGLVHGETDDFCYNVVRDPVHVHDLNATILHCLGLEHRQLTTRFQGLDVRLTGVEEHHPIPALLG
jgi:hypothetical protein